MHPAEHGNEGQEGALYPSPEEESKAYAKAIFFDLDDTLVFCHAADKAAYVAVKALVSAQLPLLDDHALVDAFVGGFVKQPWDPNHQIDVTEWRAQIWHRALQAQGVDDIDLARDLQHCFDVTRMSSFRWAPGVESMIQRMQLKGTKVGIITNGHPKIQRAKLSACRAEELFNTIVVGGEEVHEKPHKSIFMKACKLLGSKPEESIMVGDNLQTDIQGGANAGFLATVWFNIHGLDECPPVVAKPDYIIRSIDELPEVLALN